MGNRTEAKRSRRIADQERMKKRAEVVFYFLPKEAARKNANHLQSCSCWGCGNPRRHFGELTMSEKRSMDDFLSQMSDEIGK